MLRGLYTAASAVEQSSKSLDVVSNNLANINTDGYKGDIHLYEEFKSKLLYRIGGSSHFEPMGEAVVKTAREGELYKSETKDGYFKINAVNGASYHKSIHFRRDTDGFLKTFYRNSNGSIIDGKGYKLLGQKGPIQIEEGAEFNIDEKGNLIVNGEVRDSLITSRPKDVIGTMSGGIKFMRTAVDFTQGELKATHNPLDIAISGKGFFEISTPAGMRYTRDGSFKLNSEGTLVTDEGFEVVGLNGKITGLKGDIGINEFGEVMMDGEIVDKISLFHPKRDEFLKKVGGNLYRYDTDIKDEERSIEGSLMQGFLEGSNVNAVTEMVKMIEIYRNYESAQRLIRSYDDVLAKSVNDIGRL